MAKYQILTNCVQQDGAMESTQVTADKTLMSDDGQFIRFIEGDAEVAVVNARHTVYVKRI